MVCTVYGEKPSVPQFCVMLFQNLFEPTLVLFGDGQVVLHQFPIGNNGNGQELLPDFDARVPCAGGHFLGVGEDREISVGLQNGVLDRLQIQYILFP